MVRASKSGARGGEEHGGVHHCHAGADAKGCL